MSQIQINQLTFYYDGSYEEIFKDVTLSLDTEWKLGLVGRNGRGKTTFLNLLLEKYEYLGSISSPVCFDYFPFPVADFNKVTMDVLTEEAPDLEVWRLFREMNRLDLKEDILYRPFYTLSNGERTKVMLAVLFQREHHFLLIDEPTNHLDEEGRLAVSRYLDQKSGFILVSHDRIFLDGCIDHVLAINKQSIEVVKGNFSSWYEDKKRKDEYEAWENGKLKKEISRLKDAAKKTADWSDQVEKTKYSTRTAGLRPDRGFIGHKAAKMMKRSKSAEQRMEKAVIDKEKLLKDVESSETLKIRPLHHYKETLVYAENAAFAYDDGIKDSGIEYNGGKSRGGGSRAVCSRISFTLKQGERLALEGRNGCGKSTVLWALLHEAGIPVDHSPVPCMGRIETAPGLIISYVSQDTSWLRGDMDSFTRRWNLDGTLFRAVLRKLDFSREHFNKEFQYYSEGQKKKVLLAKSLCEQAHLYVWDEPLNFIDIFSRMQIEELIVTYGLTMIVVEHDRSFKDRIATKRVELYNG